MPYIKAPSGIQWHYLSKGKAKTPFLFIHGWAADFSIWFRQIDYFCDRFKVIVLDLPGHGKSDWQNIDFDSLAGDIIFICRKLKLKDITVLGLSFGGQIAIKLALRSKLIKRLILVDTSPKFVKEKDFKAGLTKHQIRKLSQQLDKNFLSILAAFARWLFTDKERQKQTFSRLWNLFKRKKCFPKKVALKKMLKMVEKIDLRREISKIKIPTLIICGQKDPICPLFVSEFLNERIPNSKLYAIKDCGHMPFLTEENKFHNIIDRFLSA